MNIILLDIDGVMNTTPSWKRPELMEDGFMRFDEAACTHLALLAGKAKAAIVLTTTHRVNYSLDEWKCLLKTRGVAVTKLFVIDKKKTDAFLSRAEEIQCWVAKQDNDCNYVILDDDPSLHGLPEIIKQRWVKISAHKGFDDKALIKALFVLGIDADTK